MKRETEKGTLRSELESAHDNAKNKIKEPKKGKEVKKTEKGKDAMKGTEKPGVG